MPDINTGTLLLAVVLWFIIAFFNGLFKAMMKSIRGGKK